MSVSDDGVGGAVVRRGSGLAGLRDRVAAHGGTFELRSPPRRRHAPGGGDPVRVVIAEDTVLLREGLAGLLEDAGHTVLARVGDAESLLAVVAEHEPDLAIVDVRMPPTYEDEGMRAAVEIRRAHPTPACSSSRSTSRAASPSSSSAPTEAFGYLLKDRVLDVGEFLDAAERVSRGGSALDPEVVKQLLAPLARRTTRSPSSRRASARCSLWSPKAGPTRASRRSCG